MDDFRPARLLLAGSVGAHIDIESLRAALPSSIAIVTPKEIPAARMLPEPFDEIPLLADRACYIGEPLAVLVGGDWEQLDAIPTGFGQTVAPESSVAPEESPGQISYAWEDQRDVDDARAIRPSATEGDESSEQIVEGHYATPLQLHQMDEPLWASVQNVDGVDTVAIATQWPAHAREAVAAALGRPVASVRVETRVAGAARDGSLHCASHVAALAAVAAYHVASPVILRLRLDQRYLTGGRTPSRVRWTSRLDAHGAILANEIEVTYNSGAYPGLVKETRERTFSSTSSVYTPVPLVYRARAERTATVPMVAFEGVASAQVAFAREVHYNRLAELAQADPIEWRKPQFRSDVPVLSEISDTLSTESDFHRRHAANELVRKRRLLLPRYSSYLKGIGCAFAEQQSGFAARNEPGAVSVTLEKGGTARLRCAIPTPSPRLRHTWRAIVADELALEHEAVILEQDCAEPQDDSGPRLFSRGVSVIPRRLVSACQGIQKRRFRDPLPISVRRLIHQGRTAPELVRSVGAAAVEASILPATMQIEVRSVTMAVFAGRIFERGAAEAELRRGIFQALAWTLHESFASPDNVTDHRMLRRYDTTFRGKPPRIRIVFVNAPMRREFSAGLSELPFLTVPAALISALSQASGLYLDTLPTRPRTILAMLREE